MMMRLSIIVDYADDHVGTVADHTKSGCFSRFINCRTEPAVVNLADDLIIIMMILHLTTNTG